MATKSKAKSSGSKTTKTTNTAKPVTVVKPSEIGSYTPGTYTSLYAQQLGNALDTVANWNYDPLKDTSYQALARVYGERGNLAAKNSLADAAALNGGYGSSYAVTAAQQARNQYNQELASLIPELENTAYNRATGTLTALREADNTDYSRFRDTESDRQWTYTQNYNKYRDLMSDYQWGMNYNYQIGRDTVSDEHWAKEYALSKKGSSGGGGGSGRSSSGGGYSSGSSSSSSSSGSDFPFSAADLSPQIQAAQKKGQSMTDYYKNISKKKSGSSSGGGGRNTMMAR